jgi:two-component system OmpR family response regulator
MAMNASVNKMHPVSWWSLHPERGQAEPQGLADYLSAFHLALRPLDTLTDPAPSVLLIDARHAGEPDLADAIVAARGRGQAVIVLLAWGSPAERAEVLDLGADDCMVAPVERRELAARILAVRRGHSQPVNPVGQVPWIRFGDWLLDTERRCLSNAQHESVTLAHAEYRLLQAFLAAPYQVVSREQLMDEARGRDTEAYDRSIDLLVSRLRAKLADDPRQPRLIQTIRGQGYLFNAVPHAPIGLATAAWASKAH